MKLNSLLAICISLCVNLLLFSFLFSFFSYPVFAKDPTTEEVAVYNRCEFISPGSACENPSPPATSIIAKLFSIFNFFFEPSNPSKLGVQAEAKQSATVPEELTAEETAEGQIRNAIQDQSGIYTVNYPDLFPEPSPSVWQIECAHNRAFAPENIDIFTDTNECWTRQ